MSYQNLIGKKLSDILKKEGNFKVIDNNFNVVGEKLVTNVKEEGKIIVLTTGEFIFDVKGNKNGN